MAQIMEAWAPAFRPTQPSATGNPSEELLHCISNETLLPSVDEERDGFAARKRRVACRGVVADNFQCRSVERNKPGFVELTAPDVQYSGFQIHVFSVEADHFTDA